jgi:glycosyltransferase involved in cell wall biosynthesis
MGQFNDTFVPIMDGVGLVARNYARWLDERYGTCYAVVPNVPGYEDDEPFPVLRFFSLPIPGKDPWRLGFPKLDPVFKKKLYAIPFDLVHTHCPFTSAEIALELARDRGIPLITTFHSKYRDDFEKTFRSDMAVSWAMNRILRFYHAADFVWVPNEGTMKTLREYGYTGEIEVMINGTDLLAPAAEEYRRYRAAGQERIGLTDEDFMFLFVGQHRWIKNIRLILESAGILRDEGRPFRLVFVGTGGDEAEIRALVEEKGLEDRVLFMGRVVEREVMKEYYGRADLFLFPSLYDTASLVMREAAAFSTPSVLIRGSSTAENVEDGVNGFLSDDDPAAFAGVLRGLMNNPGRIAAAGEGALKTIYLPWEKVVERVYERYREILRHFIGGKEGR